MMDEAKRLIPAGEGALQAGITRERLIRKIQLGAVVGTKRSGFWLVDRNSLEQFIARKAAGAE